MNALESGTSVKKDSALLLVAGIFILAIIIAIVQDVSIADVMRNYQYNILVIVIMMEFYSNLIVETGIMDSLAAKLAIKSRGNIRKIMILFGSMLFLVGTVINNISAMLIILPIIFVLLKAIKIDSKFVCIFFAMLIAVSNTGGASSPIGNFPSVIIMTSGITTFFDYLIRAMPVLGLTTAVLIAFWTLMIKQDKSDTNQEFAVQLLHSQYKHKRVDYGTLIPLCLILAVMLFVWSFVSPSIIPIEMVAVLGYVIAAVVCAIRGVKVDQTTNFKALLPIASFLFLAAVVSATGILVQIADSLQVNIADPRLLLLVMMFITSIASGLFGSGPAAAAIMPIMITWSNTHFAAQTHWLAVVYGAAICAGSSLFLWSASAGFVLSGRVDAAEIGHKWGIGSYLKYGVVNYVIQMAITVALILIIF